MTNALPSPGVWLPLEANPDVLNSYTEKLGLDTSAWMFSDVYGLDPELLAMVPQPVVALLLLFPITKKYEAFRAEEERTLDPSATRPVVFMRQTIPNACGTMGILHALSNNMQALGLSDGSPMGGLFARIRTQAPDAIARELERDPVLAKIHEESSHEGQTAAPPRDENVDLHFVCLVRGPDGILYELDGRKPCAVPHGPCTDLLQSGAALVKRFMERDPDNTQFTLISLGPADAA